MNSLQVQDPVVVVSFLVGFLVGAFLLWLLGRFRLQGVTEGLRLQIASLQARYESLEEGHREMELSHARIAAENEQLKVQVAELKKQAEADEEKLQWVEKAQDMMRDVFNALAGQALNATTTQFLHQAKEQVESLVAQFRGDWKAQRVEIEKLVEPLRENLNSIDGHVRELEQKREGAYQSLQEQLRQLAISHSELQKTAVSLTQALKSPTVKGQWGEMQLRRVVEMAGMTRHVAYAEQVTTDSGRPDMIIHLPNEGILPVDAKVPLESYLEAMEDKDEGVQKLKLDRHAKAMQDRVQELGQKKYWEQFEKAPDFVVMFVPNEACLGAAFERNPSLLEYAIERRVLITTPVTLLALLKAVAYGWQQQQITENARKIAEQGKLFYRRLETFVSHLAELRKDLNRTVEDYNRAIGSLERRLLPVAKKFEEMGVATSEVEAPQPIESHAKLPSGV
ncbi:MAG: DNA recombination protein RmuC [Deltaproteobacteria bacterium]|nr:DNA recombination protein RmuC [Deltaproteobacteria bacterium]